MSLQCYTRFAANNKKTTDNWTFRLLNDMNTAQATCSASGGNGGQGAVNGTNGTGTRDSGAGGQQQFYVSIIVSFGVGSKTDVYANTGGEGGTAGVKGDIGAQGNLYKLNTATITQNTAKAAENITNYTSESQIPQDIRDLYEWALSFDSRGGSPVPATVKTIKGEQLPTLASTSIPSKADSYFEGFFTEPVGGEKIYNHDGSVVAGSQIFTSDKTLYAHWIDTKFTIVWDYSYFDQDGTLKEVKAEDKSRHAKVQFNGMEAIKIDAGSEFNGTGNYAGHKIATATINAVVGSGVNNATTVYVTEEQLKTLSVTATALSSDDINDTDNKYVTTNVSSHEALMAAIPTGTYLQPWSITVTNGIKPDVVKVKLLSSTSENGEYTTISQMANLSVACTNNGGIYSGEYPVWPENIMNKKLYYKAQIVGFEIGGASYDVANMPLTDDISTSDNRVTLTQSVAIPVIHFDLNAPTGQTAYYATGTKEYLYINEYGKTVDVSSYSGELTDSRFEGWGTTADTKTYETSVDVNGEVTLYASWADAVPPVINFVKAEGEYTVDENDYMHGSLNVTIHIEDANDKTNTQQWYYVANNNTTKKEDVPSWTEITNGDNGDYIVTILDTDFAFGYVYIKTVDQDGNENFAVSPQYQVDIQAPMILHSPMGKREDTYSVVCSDNDYPVIFVEIVDNIGIDAVVINGKIVTTGSNLPVGVGYGWTNPNAPTPTSSSSKLYELAKPGDADREPLEYDSKGNVTVWGDVPDYKTYIITSRDKAGNTATREMTVWQTHDWNKDANGYIVEPAEEPYIDENGNYVPGLLPHVNCKHCSRYILAKKNGEWKKVDKENPSELDDVQLKPGDILLMNSKDIFAGTKSINEALLLAKNTFNQDGTEDNPLGIASIVKLTANPYGIGAKVDAVDLTNATLVNPERSLILDLNGQSIDKDGVAYTEVFGNSNITILLNDGNNRASELSTDNVPYRNLSPVTGSPIQYKRTFSSTQGGKWQALYLPFEAARPADTKVGTVKKVEIDTEAKLWIDKWADDATDNLQAYTPYFIQHAEGEMVITGTADLEGYKMDAPEAIPGGNYTIAGSLISSDRVAAATKNFWSLTNGGGFTWVKVGVGQRPYRWVIYGDPAVDTSNTAPSKAMSLFVFEPISTAVSGMSSADADSDIYTVTGIKMPSNSRLPRGLYISNGKKFYVK